MEEDILLQLNQTHQQEKENKTCSFNNLIDANVELSNKLNWLKKDIIKEISKLKYNKMTKKQVIEDLENIIKINN